MFVGFMIFMAFFILWLWGLPLGEVEKGEAPRGRPFSWSETPEDEESGRPSDLWVYIMAQDFIESELVSPGTAEFPHYRYNPAVRIVRHAGGTDYSVQCYVDSQNRFGGTVRTYWVVKMRNARGSKEWYRLEIRGGE